MLDQFSALLALLRNGVGRRLPVDEATKVAELLNMEHRLSPRAGPDRHRLEGSKLGTVLLTATRARASTKLEALAYDFRFGVVSRPTLKHNYHIEGLGRLAHTMASALTMVPAFRRPGQGRLRVSPDDAETYEEAVELEDDAAALDPIGEEPASELPPDRSSSTAATATTSLAGS